MFQTGLAVLFPALALLGSWANILFIPCLPIKNKKRDFLGGYSSAEGIQRRHQNLKMK
jgi:hypothetical protein